MGNTPSCIPLAPVSGSSLPSSTACKVIHVDSTVTRLAWPVRASDRSSCSTIQASSSATHAASPSAAACRASPWTSSSSCAALTFLLPMDMLYSVLTGEEMAALSSFHAATAASSSWKRITTAARSNASLGGRGSGRPRDSNDDVKIFSVLGLQLDHQADHDGGQAEHTIALAKSSGGAGMRRHRSWQPVLDTIEEVP